MVIQLDNMSLTVNLLRKPNGSRQFPARSCCDLKEQYPETESGEWAGLREWFRVTEGVWLGRDLEHGVSRD